jgi:hypothetical protein
MNLHVARNLLTTRRHDWLRRHLSWLPEGLYRTYLTKRK